MPTIIDDTIIRKRTHNDKQLTPEFIKTITGIIVKHGYTVKTEQPVDDAKSFYYLKCKHKTNNRLNFNTYGSTIVEIADAIYWHCENGMENPEPYCLTQEEANMIMPISEEVFALLDADKNTNTTEPHKVFAYDFQTSVTKLYEAYDKTPIVNSKSKGTSHRPNIHVYVDCSGAITCKQYMPALVLCYKLAKKHGVKFFIHSFSHQMSHKTKIDTNQTADEFKQTIMNLPKIGGGTDFEIVWQYILAKEKRQKQFSVMITDMMWLPMYCENTYELSNLYYFPIDMDDHLDMNKNANMFAGSMRECGMPIDDNMLM